MPRLRLLQRGVETQCRISDTHPKTTCDALPVTTALGSDDSTLPAGKRKLCHGLGADGGAMQSFIRRKNLENYRKQLAETKDQATRVQLAVLLAEEEAKEPAASRRRDEE